MAEREGKERPKISAFVAEYIRNGYNGSAAAISVGISPASAGVMATRWLKSVKVKRRVERHLQDSGATTEKIIREITKAAMEFDVADYQPYIDGECTLKELKARGVDTRMIEGVDISYDKEGNQVRKLKFASRKSWMDSLAKIHKMGLPDVVVKVNNQQTTVNVDETSVLNKLRGK